MSSKVRKIKKDIEKKEFENLCDEINTVKEDIIDTVDFTMYFIKQISLYRYISLKNCTVDELKNNVEMKKEFEQMYDEIMNNEDVFFNFIDTITDEEIDLIKQFDIDI